MKSNEDKFIYKNNTSGYYRVIFTHQEGGKTKVHYYGTYKNIEKAREARDEILAQSGGVNPWSTASHNMTDDQIKNKFLKKFDEEMKKG